MLALIDYGSGNIQSVLNALRHEGADVQLIDSPEGLKNADAVVLPGVGAFGDCALGLQARGFWAPLQQWLTDQKPFLGICVGYQLLFESSEESAQQPGFGYFSGRVKKFNHPGLKVPQIGWNNLEFTQPDHLLWRGLAPKSHVYFVHSFFPEPTDPSVVTATCNYGEPFAASASRGSVSGVQFHPEKSQSVGLTILRNFIQSLPA